jgi:hypothetical protein
MKTTTLRTPLFILALVGGAALATSCGDDDNAGPSTVDVTDEEDSGAGNEDTSDGDDDSGTTQTTATNGSSSSAADAGSIDDGGDTTGDDNQDAGLTIANDGGVADAGSDAGPVVGCIENDEACFSCPQTPEQFLTQCTTAQCSPFDNASRLGLYVEGEPLPTP